jgi:hypothetical protein
VAKITRQPIFKVRSDLRELIKVEFVEKIENKYQLTPEGNKIRP